MQILHLHWLTPTTPEENGRCLFWLETAAALQPTRNRRKKAAQPHPFAVDRDGLKALLTVVRLPAKLPSQTLTLWLPTNHFGPIPSPDLLHDWERDDSPPELLPWQVVGGALDAAQTVRLLTWLHQNELPAPYRLGVDGRFWQTAYTFILELLARQLIRPTLIEQRDGKATRYEARWQPLLDGEAEARRAAQLAAAMPPICRADAANPDETIPPRAILDSFLNHLADVAMRDWGTTQELYLPTTNDPAAAWLRALFAADPAIQASAGQMQHFAGSFRAWERALTIAGDKHYRVALRLEAPAQQGTTRRKKGEAAWQLHYLLQARDDASLLVPAVEVWNTKGSILQALDRYFDRPQERLLTGLGYAARFFKPIERSLQQRSPAGMSLTSDEAYAFLRQCAPQLQRAGFGLLAPPWWNKPGTRLGVRLKLGSTSKLTGQTAVATGHMNLDNLVNYRWQLSLGDTELTREEFDALVALKSPLVQIRGQWVQLDPEQIEAAIRFWEQQGMEGTLSLPEAMRLGLTVEEQQRSGLPVDGVELDDWLQSWLNRLQGDEKLEMLPVPQGLRATLRPYQQYGYSWLHFARRWGLGVILADDMGLGKCVAADTNIVVNGLPQTAATLWQRFAQNEEFDGEGYWAEPAELLTVNAIDEQTGNITVAAVHKLYRQHIQEPVRQITLEDGNQITITRQHKLLTNTGWRNDLAVGDYVCVPSKLIGEENAVDTDLALFLAWQIAEGHERPEAAIVNISQKDTKRLQAYRQKPRSKWTDRTLSTYAQLDYDFLQATRQKLQHLVDQEVFYCRIKSIEDVFYDGWVYDLEVANHHNFVANNIICHNTIQTLTMIQRLKEEMAGLPAPVLLICPTSVVTNWELERQKFTPGLQTLVHQGGDRLRDEAFIEAAQNVDMVLTSYALARRDGEALKQINWFGVALDEAQNIKNANTKQAQTIRKLPADFRLALTGTPVENRLSELWSIMQFLNPGFLGGQKQFRQEFTLPIEKYGDQEAAQRLRQMTRPFLLRRVKTDPTVIQDLPDKQEVKVYCHLSEEQATLYEAVVQDALAAIEEQEEGGMARKGLVLSMLMQLKQVCNHPAQYLHQTETYKVGEDNGRSGKLDRLTALLEEILAEGDRLLIFSQFTEMAGLLKGYIQETFGVPTLYLHGGVPPKKRAAMVEQFQREDGPPVFLLSLKAGGTGLNLTRANHVFHFDRWWNPAVEDQATDRAFRIGQTKNVLVHKFVCLGTLEERIDAMIEDKKALAESIVGKGENWLTEMGTADLRTLVKLRQ
ncbi:MAG: helicase [Anaerolinea sp.]|nr:helicase [Anaerolinea sp.]